MVNTTEHQTDPAQITEQAQQLYQALLQTNPPLATAAGRMMASQTAALMLEDMRAFLQGSEQVLLVALAKAAQLATEENTTEQGKLALAAVAESLRSLATFASEITESASQVATVFDKKASS
jgi:hypothetical protein